ncbi:cobyric acid synthase [Ferrovibrio terrae]|jgi:adenosylcobyric acid synthase|uniref:cobyric acid synthase n=1 Tax=Ferrovibrio terrae TaxID=2594003 RepID=UPI0031382008
MKQARSLMFQGTGSDVGKSVLCAGVIRALVRRGHRVLPFKPQNMSNNAAVTADGGEIGRAQALQARAANVPTSVHMNPVLLKPQGDRTSQIVVQGKIYAQSDARGYLAKKAELWPFVAESFARLKADADFVIVEGAGSPAEVNLRANDIANMGFATRADVPVVLVGDIDRGGVIASLVGTAALLEPEEMAMVAGYVINKFRGDASLFDDGLKIITQRTGWRSFGVLPHLPEVARLPAEDALGLDKPNSSSGEIVIAIPRLSHIANFDDFDPLRQDASVRLVFVNPGQPLPADAALVILPGSKATIADLKFFRAQGWDVDLAAHLRRGGRVLGICGGYQMLGRSISDPNGIEGPAEAVEGLGLLAVDTVLTKAKTLTQVQGFERFTGELVQGYEMHVGSTAGVDAARPFLRLQSRHDGAVSADGRVAGCYLHGLFSADAFRAAFLSNLSGRDIAAGSYEAGVDSALDALAAGIERHLDVDALIKAAR